MAKIKKEELKDVTITHVSYVKRPANRQSFFFAKSEDGSFQADVNFIEKSEEQRLLYGIVYEPDVEDAHGDCMTAQEIEKMAHEFIEFYRNIDQEHNMRSGVGVVVESYIAPADIETESGTVIRKGTWILVTRASEELWTLWKSGEITGYSMFGIARQVSKGETKLKKFIGAIAEIFGVKKDFSETAQAQIDRMARSPWFIMDMLTEEYLGSVDWDADENVKLENLSLALSGAKDYVDGLIAKRVAKSEEPTVPESSTEPPTEPTEPTEPEVPETPSEPAEPETPTEPEPASQSDTTFAKSEDNGLKAILEGIVKSIETLGDKITALEANVSGQETSIEGLLKSYDVIKSAVDDSVTSSAVRVAAEKTTGKRPIVNSQPLPGEGLI